MRIDVCAAVLSALFTALTGPFTGLILRRDLGATPFHLSALASANAACLLMSLALTRVIDGRRPLASVVWTTVIARSLFLLVPFIDSPWPFVSMLAMVTLIGTITTPAQAALVQQVYPRDERGRALSVIRVAAAIAGIGLALFAGHFVGWSGYRVAFPFAAVFGIAAALTLRRLPVPVVGTEVSPVRPSLRLAWATIRRDSAFRRLLAASAVFGSGIWMMTPVTPLLQVDVLGVTTAQVGLFAAFAAATAIVANLAWGRLADHHSSLTTLRTVYICGSLTPIIYYVACTFVRTPWILIAASISESLLATGLDLVWMLAVIDFAGPRRTAQYAAIGATLAGVRGVIAPLISAALVHAVGLAPVYAVAAVLMATGALMVTLQIRGIRREAVVAARSCARAGLLRLREMELAR